MTSGGAARSAPKKCRAWLFTLNERKGAEALPARWTDLPQAATYMVYQLEKGETDGRLHYQGFVRWAQQVSLKTAKRRLGHDWIHLDAVAVDNGAASYCMKEATRVEGPWEFGTPPQQVVRLDRARGLKRVAEEGLERAVVDQPALVGSGIHGLKYLDFVMSKKRRLAKGDAVTGFLPPSILILVGAPDLGKSRLAREIPTKGWWKKPALKTDWWDGYCGEQTIILDDFYGQIPYSELIDLLDGYPKQVQTKGGFVMLENTTWIITSNKFPTEWYSLDSVRDQTALMSRIFPNKHGVFRNDSCVWDFERRVEKVYDWVEAASELDYSSVQPWADSFDRFNTKGQLV